jgi:hypothetical protein
MASVSFRTGIRRRRRDVSNILGGLVIVGALENSITISVRILENTL